MEYEKKHYEVMRSIGRIEGVLQGIASDTSEMKNDLKLQNGRIAKMEEWKNQQVGEQKIVSIIYGGVSAIVISVIGYFIKK